MLLTDVQFVLVTHELHQALWLLPIPEHTALLLFHLQRPDDYIDYFCLQQGQGTSPPEIMSALRHQILVRLGHCFLIYLFQAECQVSSQGRAFCLLDICAR